MTVWDATTNFLCCRCFCPKKVEESTGNGEAAPLLNGEDAENDGFTAGYTRYVDSSTAMRVFLIHGFCYYAAAVIMFSYVLDTQWDIVDSLYFATVLFTTIGYGDLYPKGELGRFCTIGLAIYGIVILGIFLGSYGESLLESFSIQESEEQMNVQAAVVENMISAAEDGDTANGNGTNGNGTNGNGANGNGTNGNGSNGNGAHVSAMSTEDEKPETEFEYTLWGDIVAFLYHQTPIFLVVICAGLTIGHFEGWTIGESLYWTVITGTTVGFGDESPSSHWTRGVCIIFLPFCVAVLGESISRIAELYLRRKRRKAQAKFFERSLTMADLKAMDTNHDGHVSKAEFLCFMLCALQRVERDDLQVLLKLFDRLDRMGDGVLREADLEQYSSAMKSTMSEIGAMRGGSMRGSMRSTMVSHSLTPDQRQLFAESGSSLSMPRRKPASMPTVREGAAYGTGSAV